MVYILIWVWFRKNGVGEIAGADKTANIAGKLSTTSQLQDNDCMTTLADMIRIHFIKSHKSLGPVPYNPTAVYLSFVTYTKFSCYMLFMRNVITH